MQPRVHPALASQHYRSLELASRVGEASPHGLVTMLYEELLGSLDVVIAVIRSNATVVGHPHVAKARSILVALEASLDFERGGELAPVLAKVYRSAGRELGDAAGQNDANKLTELRRAISDIAYAWSSLSTV